MPPADEADSAHLDAYHQLRHDLKTPLTTIYGRAQLLTRAVRKSPSLAEVEQAKLLAGLAAIEAAVLAAVAVIDGINDQTVVPDTRDQNEE